MGDWVQSQARDMLGLTNLFPLPFIPARAAAAIESHVTLHMELLWVLNKGKLKFGSPGAVLLGWRLHPTSYANEKNVGVE